MEERRFIKSNLRALKATGLNSIGRLIGYAARYSEPNSGPQNLSEDLGGFRERVGRNAFKKSLASRANVTALQNHDPNYLLGRTTTGTCRLTSDDIGLRMDVDLPDTSYAKDLFALVQRQDLSQMSFAFQVDSDSWDEEDDPNFPDDRSKTIRVRTIQDVRLLDVSCVTNPAYASTSLEAFPYDARSLWPNGMPMEIRSHLSVRSRPPSKGREARQKLFSLILS
jgi:HK97 family phage prohead protease